MEPSAAVSFQFVMLSLFKKVSLAQHSMMMMAMMMLTVMTTMMMMLAIRLVVCTKAGASLCPRPIRARTPANLAPLIISSVHADQDCDDHDADVHDADHGGDDHDTDDHDAHDDDPSSHTSKLGTSDYIICSC